MKLRVRFLKGGGVCQAAQLGEIEVARGSDVTPWVSRRYFGKLHGEERRLLGGVPGTIWSRRSFISFKQMLECLSTTTAVLDY